MKKIVLSRSYDVNELNRIIIKYLGYRKEIRTQFKVGSPEYKNRVKKINRTLASARKRANREILIKEKLYELHNVICKHFKIRRYGMKMSLAGRDKSLARRFFCKAALEEYKIGGWYIRRYLEIDGSKDGYVSSARRYLTRSFEKNPEIRDSYHLFVKKLHKEMNRGFKPLQYKRSAKLTK